VIKESQDEEAAFSTNLSNKEDYPRFGSKISMQTDLNGKLSNIITYQCL